MSFTIDCKTPTEAENAILEMAEEIRERRRLLADGCSCEQYGVGYKESRCETHRVVCPTRRHEGPWFTLDDADRDSRDVSFAVAPARAVRIRVHYGDGHQSSVTFAVPGAIRLRNDLDKWLHENGATGQLTRLVPPGEAVKQRWTLDEIKAAFLRAEETGRPMGHRPRSEADLENSWSHLRGALTGEQV